MQTKHNSRRSGNPFPKVTRRAVAILRAPTQPSGAPADTLAASKIFPRSNGYALTFEFAEEQRIHPLFQLREVNRFT